MVAGALVVFSRQGGAQQPAQPAATVAAVDTGSLKGPRQPIFFRHDIHAGQKQMPCQYCHYSAGVSNEPGIPSMQTCMGCHNLMVNGSTPENKAIAPAAKRCSSSKIGAMMNSERAFSVLIAKATIAPLLTVCTKSSRSEIGGT